VRRVVSPSRAPVPSPTQCCAPLPGMANVTCMVCPDVVHLSEVKFPLGSADLHQGTRVCGREAAGALCSAWHGVACTRVQVPFHHARVWVSCLCLRACLCALPYRLTDAALWRGRRGSVPHGCGRSSPGGRVSAHRTWPTATRPQGGWGPTRAGICRGRSAAAVRACAWGRVFPRVVT
jgi:hypothetical protein